MAQNAIVNAPNVTAIAGDDGMFSDARLQMIRDAVAKDAPEAIFRAMIEIARKRNLDPLAKQIICAKFGSAWQFIVTIDGYRAIAEQTGRYAGSDAPLFTWPREPIVTSANKTAPDSATVTVYKLIDGQRYPFSATVYWEEYDAGRNNWVSMPRTMLAKVSESHALRKAFPAVLSGTYSDAEMNQAYVEVSGQVADRRTGEIRSGPSPSSAAPRASTSRPASKSGSQGANSDGKAIHFRGKISALTEPLGFTAGDLDAAAEAIHNAPYQEIDGGKVEVLYNDLADLHREGDLADYLKQLRAPADAIDVVDVEVIGE